MTRREIVVYPDPVLKAPTELVTEFGPELTTLLKDMAETMYDASGIGLAAPQIGVLKRVTVVDTSPDGSELIYLVNPKIVSRQGKTSSEEGCLSIPGYREKVERAESIVVQAQDETGKEIEFEAYEILSICIQHELDHLDGVLFIDRLSRLKQNLFKKWYNKQGELTPP